MSAGRPKVFVEDEALDEAIKLFWKYGYEATSTEDLLAAMKMGKGSMYHNFGGKKAVFKLALDKYFKDFVKNFPKALEESDDHIEFIKDFFRAIAIRSVADYKRGCFMGNIMAELAAIDPSLESKAIEVMKRFEQIIKSEIIKGKESGRLKTKEDPKVLARYLLNLWNGTNITGRMYPDRKELAPLIEFQLQVLS
jgi:TetR/AcrR family transcriptional repressor of nem operon